MLSHTPTHQSRPHIARGARAAILAGLGLSLALGGMAAPPARAYAEEGTITITQQHNVGATYDAYQLFSADIDEHDNASHLAWASDAIKSLVLQFLDKNGYQAWLADNNLDDDQHDRAQNAAAYVAQMIGASEPDAGAATTPQTTVGTSFANRLAQELATKGAAPHETATSGEPFTQQEGYWLFVSTDATTEADSEAGTAPIWVALGGSLKTVLEKSAIPTVDKEIREDSTKSWGKVADAHTDQEVAYRLTGTLPANFGAFDRYHYRFVDTLADGLEVSVPEGTSLADAIRVEIGGIAVPQEAAGMNVTYEKGVLTVDIANLKDSSWDAYHITKDTQIIVSYQAHLTEERALGSAGNANGVQLTYTDDPISNGEGHTPDDDKMTKLFAYELTLTKVDEQTGVPLEGAGFTVQVADDSSDEASCGKYVQADGSLADDGYVFVSGSDGTLTVQGIDEGAYVIHEVTAPKGYDELDHDITLVVSSELDHTNKALVSLTATASGGDDLDSNATSETKVTATDPTTGAIALNVTNDKLVPMPLTGLNGLGAAPVVGATTALGAGIALVLRRRKIRW